LCLSILLAFSSFTIVPTAWSNPEYFGVDLIQNGEMIVWDNIDREKILFGKNKKVAKMRIQWCTLNILFDECDLNSNIEVKN